MTRCPCGCPIPRDARRALCLRCIEIERGEGKPVRIVERRVSTRPAPLSEAVVLRELLRRGPIKTKPLMAALGTSESTLRGWLAPLRYRGLLANDGLKWTITDAGRAALATTEARAA